MHTYVAFLHHLIACRTGDRGNPDGGGLVGDTGTRSSRGARRGAARGVRAAAIRGAPGVSGRR